MMICTDSVASMSLIDTHMRCPCFDKECKHEELLSFKKQHLAKTARDGIHVHLLKVKSHIGIEGIEMADRLAHGDTSLDVANDTALEGTESEKMDSSLSSLTRQGKMPLEGLRTFSSRAKGSRRYYQHLWNRGHAF